MNINFYLSVVCVYRKINRSNDSMTIDWSTGIYYFKIDILFEKNFINDTPLQEADKFFISRKCETTTDRITLNVRTQFVLSRESVIIYPILFRKNFIDSSPKKLSYGRSIASRLLRENREKFGLEFEYPRDVFRYIP